MIVAVVSSSPPVGYHKVIRSEDLSDSASEEEEEVYVKEEPTKTKGPAYMWVQHSATELSSLSIAAKI